MPYTLDESLLIETKKEVSQINMETKEIVETIKENGLNELKKLQNERINHQKSLAESSIKAHEIRLNKSIVQYEKQIKYHMVSQVFEQLYHKLIELSGQELCLWINQLFDDSISNDAKGQFVVSNDDYDRYLNAISSTKNPKELNMIGFHQLCLEKGKLPFEHGFMLVLKDFDLFFDLKEIIKTYQDKKQKEVFVKLFGDE